MAYETQSKAFVDKDKPREVRETNITAGKAVADAVRTSLGPRGMDKMITDAAGEVTITNDGATILNQMQVLHPAAKMLVEVSKAQDIEAGDGTTSVVVLSGALLTAAQRLLAKGIHPTVISTSFQMALAKSKEILKNMSTPVSLDDREALLQSANTSLNSKVVAQYSDLLGPIAVDAVLKCRRGNNVDLNDVRIVKKIGGTVEDTEIITDGLLIQQSASHKGPTVMKNAKVALIQFCLSAPKTDIDNQILVSDYTAMDRVFREERQYILNLCKAVKKSGANVVLVQKSILRDNVNDISLHFLAKLGIMCIPHVERDEVEFVSKTLGCRPVANPEDFTKDKLGTADLIEEVKVGSSHIVRATGVKNPGATVSILCRGSNKLVMEECERSIHDALCVIRCLVKVPFLISGGGAPETQLSVELAKYSHSLSGIESYCVRLYAEALEVIPLTLAENAGLNPISVVTELRTKHAAGEKDAGINVKKGTICNIRDENVVQPLLVTQSALSLATETVSSILKIDDVLFTR